MRKLNDRGLLRTAAYVDGKWLDSTQSFEVINPYNGAVIATVADMAVSDVRAAIDTAKIAQPKWAALTGKERASILRRWFDLIQEHADDLATILTAEMGKPWAEARGEVVYGASFIEWFAEEAKRVYGDIVPGHQPDKRIMVMKQPIGVVGSITPWNFPNAMIARKVAPALAAGCTFVARPSELTPLSALAMAELADRAGIPAGVFSVLPSLDAAGVGKELCTNPDVAKITFTGSTRVGKILMEQCAGGIKKMSLELGGNAPFIVFEDADLESAVEGAMIAKFRNNGQTCVCANRIYVQAAIYDQFAQKLAERIKALTPGNGFDADVNVGPLINEAAVEKVEEHIRNAKDGGADVVLGGQRIAGKGTCFAPTLLTGVTRDMQVSYEETFGPVAPIIKFEDTAEVIDMANATEFGLAAYFYSRDLARVWKVAEALETGMVGVNTGLISTEVAPFGGIKQSGLGREGSKYGIEDYLELKYVCLGDIA